MFDSLEARRMLAGNPFVGDQASFKNGVLRISGTDGSDKISVTTYYVVDVGKNGKGKTVRDFRVNVELNGTGIANVSAADTRRVNIYGNGGNDKILGAGSDTRVAVLFGYYGRAEGYVATSDGKTVTVGKSQTSGRPVSPIKTLAAQAIPPLYVEGGRGNDTIAGGAGNDTLLGGAGNDTLSDLLGKNTLNGGSGQNTLRSLSVVRGVVSGHAVLDSDDRTLD